MKKKILLVIFILLIGFSVGTASYYFVLQKYINTGAGQAPPPVNFKFNIRDRDRDFAQVVAAVTPTVVNIATTKKSVQGKASFFNDDLFDFLDEGTPKKRQQSLGSGVIVSPDGYILTNYHVIEGADEIKVTLYDKSTYKGKVTGIDPKTDLAVVKIEATSLPAARWSDSDILQVGEFVLAFGNPYGLSHTVTMGIISAVGRANVGIADYEDFIQTDAAINPGNSGGPLVDARGELIGINTAIFSRSGGYQGIGFAVPSNMARSVFEQLAKEGKVIRGWIGVTIQDLSFELAESFGLKNANGALVSDILKGSPADKAGLRRGDVVISFDRKDIQNVSVLRNMVAQSRIGSDVEIKIMRNRNVRQFRVLIAELPKEFSESGPETPEEQVKKEVLGGITVIQLNRDFARQLGLDIDEKGVIIVNVERGSPADDAGLKRGDVIQELDGHPILTLKDFNTSAASIGDNATIVLYINRNGRKFYTPLRAS
jgi:serine protease Do